LRSKLDELGTNSKTKNIQDLCRGIINYRPRSNTVKDEKGDLIRLYSMLTRRRNHFSQLLNVHGVNESR